MKLKRSHVVLLSAALVSVAAIGLWINRPREGTVDLLRFEASLGKNFGSSPAASIDSAESVRVRLEAAPSGPPPGLEPGQGGGDSYRAFAATPAQHESLLATVGEWIHLLHVGDPDAYSQWAEGRGCTLSQSPELRERCALSFKHMTGKALPDEASPREVFSLMFGASLGYRGGETRPATLSGADGGIRIRYLECKGITNFARVFFRTSAEIYRWVGYEAKRTRQHWQPPATLEGLYARDGFVPCAVVSVAWKGGTGKWSPVNAMLYLDSATGRWHFHQVVIVNAPSVSATLDY